MSEPVIQATDANAPQGYEAVKTDSGWLHVITLKPCEHRQEQVEHRPDCSKCKITVMYCRKHERRTTRAICKTCGG